MNRSIFYKAETVGSDDGTRMDDHAVSNTDILINNHSRVKDRVVPYRRVLPDVATSFDDCTVAYRSTSLNNDVGPDLHILSGPRGGRHSRAGMNPGIVAGFCQQPRCRTCKCQLWIRHCNHRSRWKFTGSKKHTTRMASIYIILTLLLCVTQIGRTCIFQACNGIQHHRRISAEFSAYVVGNLLSRSFHPFLLRNSATRCALRSACSIQAGTEAPSRKFAVTNTPGIRCNCSFNDATQRSCPMLYCGRACS